MKMKRRRERVKIDPTWYGALAAALKTKTKDKFSESFNESQENIYIYTDFGFKYLQSLNIYGTV